MTANTSIGPAEFLDQQRPEGAQRLTSQSITRHDRYTTPLD
jgi:hypothetical protein